MGLPAAKLHPEDQAFPQDLAETLRPWERLPREGEGPWALFMAYRDMAWPQGPGHTFVERQISGAGGLAEMAGMNADYLHQLSRAYWWKQRAGAWDREVQRRRDAADLSEAEVIRQRQQRRLAKLSNILEIEINKLASRASDPDLPQMTPKDIVSTAEFITKQERLMAGESTENVNHTGAWDLEKLSVDDLAELDRIRRKAQGGG